MESQRPEQTGGARVGEVEKGTPVPPSPVDNDTTTAALPPRPSAFSRFASSAVHVYGATELLFIETRSATFMSADLRSIQLF